MGEEYKFKKIDDYRWEIPKVEGMRVPGLLYADEKMLKVIQKERTPIQVKNVAYLPGIVKYSLAMPDMHWGYGFAIGGVAATDPEKEGVISPGGIGYDINCLSGESSILSSFGWTLKIKDFENIWKKKKINCFDFQEDALTSTSLIRFLKRFPENKVYKLTTETGKTIIATEEHPFYTEDGMIPLRRLKEREKIAIYPFKGVPYEEPSGEIIIDEEKVRNSFPEIKKNLTFKQVEQIIFHLKKRKLLPLKYNSPSLPYLLKIMGYIWGDEKIFFEEKGTVKFYGKPEDLREIRRDISYLGYISSRIYYQKDKPAKEAFCKVNSKSFIILLNSLEVPFEEKTKSLPEWLLNAPLWQKRLFLSALFGAKLSLPKVYPYCPVISLNKKKEFAENGIKFLKDISFLLSEFGVRTQKISRRLDPLSKKREKPSYWLCLILSGEPQDLINLYEKIGFEYNRKERFLANIVVHFLSLKKLASNLSYIHFHPQKSSLYYYEEEREPLYFNKFLKEITAGLGYSGMVWERIISKREINFPHYVYDFTVKHPHHNFVANHFVVSNCGVRLMRTNLHFEDIKDKLSSLLRALFIRIPCGVGSTSSLKLPPLELKKVLKEGAKWAIGKGYGLKEDLERTEEYGRMEGANPEKVSEKALKRGYNQLGTLGSGNHFLEIDIVENIYLPNVAEIFGLKKGGIAVTIHSGSRGLGYQICDDYLVKMRSAVGKYKISLPDRQLSCAPLISPEGRDYFAAMACAANYAWCNRQIMMHWARETLAKILKISSQDMGMKLVYDVCHNIGKFEEHIVNGEKKKLFVHRKGATRAFPPFHPLLPEIYRSVGQPVLIPGDMGTSSYVMVGTDLAMKESWGSTCHGAGRVMSRSRAKKAAQGRNLEKELKDKGILIIAKGRGTIAEEMPEAYKDVDQVVKIVEKAGLSKKVAKLRPLGVIKG